MKLKDKKEAILFAKETDEGKKALIVPNHKEIDKGTLVEIIRQAGLKREELLKLLE